MTNETKQDNNNVSIIIGDVGDLFTSIDMKSFIEYLCISPYHLWDPKRDLETEKKLNEFKESNQHRSNQEGHKKILSALTTLADKKIPDVNTEVSKALIGLKNLLSYDPLQTPLTLLGMVCKQFNGILGYYKIIRKIIKSPITHDYDGLECILISAAALVYYYIGDLHTVELLWNKMPTGMYPEKPRYVQFSANRNMMLSSEAIRLCDGLYSQLKLSGMDMKRPTTVKEATRSLETICRLIG